MPKEHWDVAVTSGGQEISGNHHRGVRRSLQLGGRVVAAVALAAAGLVVMPVTASAADVSDAAELRDAFATGGTVTLTADITNLYTDPPLVVGDDKSVILDLNGYSLEATGDDGVAGVGVPEGASLTVRDSAPGELNKLKATAGAGAAGIGASATTGAGTITIDSGRVLAVGRLGGAGIGGSEDSDGGFITVNGGSVSALGGMRAAGIGGGGVLTENVGGDGGTITINGGSVVASTGDSGAGIGGGRGGDGGTVTINGGQVRAGSDKHGAGIGGGRFGSGGTITITDGAVNASSESYGAGIGGGEDGDGGNITISGGTVEATAVYRGAGIGGGSGGDGGTIIISGGEVTATSGTSTEDTNGSGAAIGGGGTGSGGIIVIGADSGDPVRVSATAGVGSTWPLADAVGGGSVGPLGSVTVKKTGELTIHSPITIADGETFTNEGTLILADDVAVTVDGTLTNDGTITSDVTGTDVSGALNGSGTVANNGTMTRNVEVSATSSDELTVTGNTFMVMGLMNDVSDSATAFALSFVVYAPTMGLAGATAEEFPAPAPWRPGYDFTGWYLTADASGDPVNRDTTLADNTDLPGIVALYAGWADHVATTLYAYPDGAAASPTECLVATDLTDGCSLDDALAVAKDGDTVILAANPGGDSATFATSEGWDIPQDSLTIQADDGVSVALDGNETAPSLLRITGTGTVTVSDLTIRNTVGSYGAIPGGGVVNGGGGDLVVERSTFLNNVVHGTSSGIALGGGIVNVSGPDNPAGNVRVTSSTFYQNTAFATDMTTMAVGGGIVSPAGGHVAVVASTFVGNAVDPASGGTAAAGAVVKDSGDGLGIASSVFAGNTASCFLQADAELVASGYNVADDDSCSFAPSVSQSNVTGLADTLHSLANNGGPTSTMLPTYHSPALGMVPVNTTIHMQGSDVTLCPTTDQRGIASAAGEACAAGSVQGFSERPTVDRYVAVTGTDDGNDCLDPTDPCRTIDYAVGRVAAASSDGFETIHVGPGVYEESVQVAVNDQTDLTIVGSGSSGASATVIAGEPSSADAVTLSGAKSITVKDLHIQGAGADGLAVEESMEGDVTVLDSVITDSGDDGIDVRARGTALTMTVEGSTISGNGDGVEIGTAAAEGVDITFTDCDISDNDDGIVLEGESSLADVVVSNTTFTGHNDYGAEANGGIITISFSTFTGNNVGVNVDENGQMVVRNSTLAGNEYAGALTETNGDMTLWHTEVRGNYGLGLVVKGSSSLTLTESTVTGTLAAPYYPGIGVLVEKDATVHIVDSEISDNTELAARLDGGTALIENTVTVSGLIAGDGTLGGDGTLVNHGAIWNTVTVDVSDELTVTDHHYLVSFDGNGGTSTAEAITVYGPSLIKVGLSLADVDTPTRSGYTFTGWFPTAAATGSKATDSTEFTGSSSDGQAVTVSRYAGWNEDAVIPDPSPASVTVAVGDAEVSTGGVDDDGVLVPTEDDALEAPSGATVTVEVSGFEPDVELSVTVHSDPVLLGTITVDSAGAGSLTATLPASLDAGAHTIEVVGVDAAGHSVTARLPILVAAADDDGTGAGDDEDPDGSETSTGDDGSGDDNTGDDGTDGADDDGTGDDGAGDDGVTDDGSGVTTSTDDPADDDELASTGVPAGLLPVGGAALLMVALGFALATTRRRGQAS